MEFTNVSSEDDIKIEPILSEVCSFNGLDSDDAFINKLIDELPDIQYIEDVKPPIIDSNSHLKTDRYDTEKFLSNEVDVKLVTAKDHVSETVDNSKLDICAKTEVAFKLKILCPICREGNAGRHKHYGGKACSSCRAFFRRSVQNDSYKSFLCVNVSDKFCNERCSINSTSWSSCRFCRFAQCIESGLQISLVLTPIQRDLRKMKRNSKTKKSMKYDSPLLGKSRFADPNANRLSTSSFEDEEVTLISFKIKQFIYGYMQKSMASYMTQTTSFFDSFLDNRMGKRPVSDKSFISFWRSTIQRYLWDTNEVHNRLHQTTVNAIFNQNMRTANFMIGVLSMGNGVIPCPLKEILHDVCERQKYLAGYLPHTLTHQQELNLKMDTGDDQINYENCVTILAMRSLKQNTCLELNPRPLYYDEAYPSQIWVGRERNLENTFRKNIEDVAKWPLFDAATEGKFGEQNHIPSKNTNIDYIPFFLLIIVSIYSSEIILNGTRDKVNVERLQNQHLHLIYKYLKFHYRNEVFSRLASGMTILSKARESCQILESIQK